MNTQDARFNMVEQQIRTWNVLDPAVLSVLSAVKREDFTPSAYSALAYSDTEIPLGHGQFMLPPRIDARLLQDLGLHGHEKVLEAGTGSGYLTALLALRCKQVLSLELQPELAQQAQRNLALAGIQNAKVLVANAATDPIEQAPFDAIILGGSVAEAPQNLLNLLNIGGRLIAIVGEEPIMQATLYTRDSTSSWTSKALWDSCTAALQGFSQPSKFSF
jgi:protein-L-isoaspartate(D-aspartate) O-methyltransferase